MEYNQNNFINNIKSKYTLSTLPHSIILLGDSGSGHEYVCSELAEYFDTGLYNITDMISTDYINQIYLCSTPTIYIVNLNNISEKEQNILLKLFEDPTSFAYLILYGESLYNVLDTIQNRGQIMFLDKYSTEYLETLVTENKDLVLNLCTTPGQVEIANHTDMESMKKLCVNMVEKMSVANFYNTLTISNKINFSDEYSKYDFNLFIKMLEYIFLQSNSYQQYKMANEVSKTIIFMNDKKSYFDNFLIRLWKLSRGVN